MRRAEHILEQLQAELGFSSQLLGGRNAVLAQIDRFLTRADVPEDLAPTSQPRLWNSLISEVIVPETSFFRYPESFAMLREWARTRRADTLRALCVPCSTGEEAYSIAITLREAGSSGFQIRACDASARSVAHAREGHYRTRNMRGLPEALKDLWFRLHGDEDSIVAEESIRAPITFDAANIFTMDAPAHGFDFIFCRNLLIYLDPENQHRIFGRINLWLKPEGLLFLGPGEATTAASHGWKGTGHPMSFSFVRATEPSMPIRTGAGAPRKFLSRRAAPPTSLTPARKAAPAPVEALEKIDWFARAVELADAGQLPAATEALAKFHGVHDVTAPSLLLRGILEEEQGSRDAAETSYRKALYLQPDHLDALLHLSLLLESEGRTQSATPFRRRIERLSAAS